MILRRPRRKRSTHGPARGGAWLALFAVVFLNFVHGLHGPWMPGMSVAQATTNQTGTVDHAQHTTQSHHDPAHHHHAVAVDGDAALVDAAEPPPSHQKHQMPPMCPLCQAMHAMGGVLPVSAFVLVRHVERPVVFAAIVHKPRIVLAATASARGPPASR